MERAGSFPSIRYASTCRLTQAFGPPASPCVPAPRSVTSAASGCRRRSSSAPAYGVAASRSPARISVGGSSPGATRTSIGVCRGSFQYAHGRFIQAFSQVSNGAVRASRVWSRSQVCQLVGHGASLHSTAV